MLERRAAVWQMRELTGKEPISIDVDIKRLAQLLLGSRRPKRRGVHVEGDPSRQSEAERAEREEGEDELASSSPPDVHHPTPPAPHLPAMSVQPYHHYDDDHADISAVRLAELFGCMDGSYATTVAAHHGEQMDLIERSDIDSTTSWTSEEMQISNRMESTTRTVRS